MSKMSIMSKNLIIEITAFCSIYVVYKYKVYE